MSAAAPVKQALLLCSSFGTRSWGVLEDGLYDALVVDATADGETIALDLTILGGAHKGEVVSVRAHGMDMDDVDILGMPGTLVVENGVPAFTVER